MSEDRKNEFDAVKDENKSLKEEDLDKVAGGRRPSFSK